MHDDPKAIAAKLTEATGPSREIDCLIAEMLNPENRPDNRVMYYGEPTGEHVLSDGERPEGFFVKSPAYTASLDAALTLVPEGFGWRLWVPNASAPEKEPFVTLWGDGRSYAPRDVIAATPALALCAAAITARALLKDQPHVGS